MNELLAIERAVFRRDAYDRNLFAEYARRCEGLFLVAERPIAESAARMAGYSIACLTRGQSGLASLVSIAAHPEAQGTGAASLLLSSTIRRLKLRGVDRLTLIVRISNARAIHFYERHGFTRLRLVPGYYEGREDGILMRRLLGSTRQEEPRARSQNSGARGRLRG
jgi:ribosomal protein S18 acetylase RimI-like enzyme